MVSKQKFVGLKAGCTIEYRTYDNRVLRAQVIAVFDTVGGMRARVQSGQLLQIIRLEQIEKVVKVKP
jgi:hypothetical protein